APGPSAAEAGAASRFVLPPEPELRAAVPIGRVRVTAFRHLLADPYGWALGSLLDLAPLDDQARELDGLRFGDLAHEVLERFGRGAEVHSADAGVVAARLDALLDACARERFGERGLPVVRLQVEQLRARLRAFAHWH